MQAVNHSKVLYSCQDIITSLHTETLVKTWLVTWLVSIRGHAVKGTRQNERKCSGEEVTEQTLQLFFLFHSSSTQTQCLFQPLHIHRTLQIILTYFIGVRINVPMADILFILFGFNQTSKSDGNFNVTRLPNLNYSNTTSAFQ